MEADTGSAANAGGCPFCFNITISGRHAIEVLKHLPILLRIPVVPELTA